MLSAHQSILVSWEGPEALGTRTPSRFSGERGESGTTGYMMKGNDPLKKKKKQLDSRRWALQIATVPIVSQPPLIKIKNNLDPTIRTALVSSGADMKEGEWEGTKGQKGQTVGIIWWAPPDRTVVKSSPRGRPRTGILIDQQGRRSRGSIRVFVSVKRILKTRTAIVPSLLLLIVCCVSMVKLPGNYSEVMWHDFPSH